MRQVTLAAALLGGVLLVANLFVDADALAWAGLALVGLAVAALGARLVEQPWLAVITAAGSVALGWAVLAVLNEAVDGRQLDAAVGGVATLGVAVAVMRSPTARDRPGNHRS